MVHKILREMCPDNHKGKFTRRNKISKYETRRINDLQVPKPGRRGSNFSNFRAYALNE